MSEPYNEDNFPAKIALAGCGLTETSAFNAICDQLAGAEQRIEELETALRRVVEAWREADRYSVPKAIENAASLINEPVS